MSALPATGGSGTVAELVTSMAPEIDFLRQTVARFRGCGVGRSGELFGRNRRMSEPV
jgi:hypothetical protein